MRYYKLNNLFPSHYLKKFILFIQQILNYVVFVKIIDQLELMDLMVKYCNLIYLKRDLLLFIKIVLNIRR